MRPEDAHRIKAGMWIPSVRLRRASKDGTDGIRAVTVTHEPVKQNPDGESWYRVTIEMGRPQFSGPMPRGRRRIPRPPTQGTESARGCTSRTASATARTADAGWSGGSTDMVTSRHVAAPGRRRRCVCSWDAVNQAAAEFALLQGTITLSRRGTTRARCRPAARSGSRSASASATASASTSRRSARSSTAASASTGRGPPRSSGRCSTSDDATGTVFALTDTSGTLSNRSMEGPSPASPVPWRPTSSSSSLGFSTPLRRRAAPAAGRHGTTLRRPTCPRTTSP